VKSTGRARDRRSVNGVRPQKKARHGSSALITITLITSPDVPTPKAFGAGEPLYAIPHIMKTLIACRVPLPSTFLKFLLCGAATAVWAMPGTAKATLGNYPNTTAPLSGNATVTPDAAPSNTASINVSTSTNFKGRLEGNPGTGVVRV
jgi:hypothetical protein